MGACGSKEESPNVQANTSSLSIDPKLAAQKSKEIDKQLIEEKSKKEIKILLLGTAETGKSTVLKQLRIIHGGGFNDEDTQLFRCAVRKNIFDTARILVDAMAKLKIPYGFDKSKLDPVLFPSAGKTRDTDGAIKLIWADTGVQYCFSRNNEFQIVDLSYFMKDIDSFNRSDYAPTNQDILASRIMTSGVNETKVVIKGTIFKVKWIHVFDNVSAIFFLMDLSSFNLFTVEDVNVNRIVESITVFSFICNHASFKKSAIVVFMNKIDLLKDKLESEFVADYFPDLQDKMTIKTRQSFCREGSFVQQSTGATTVFPLHPSQRYRKNESSTGDCH
ncbi:G-alpha-domain-containing protein [Rhizoclosmatium globosum]|uniref:G-alpha-domain-containing protein n=1 Tax=Rhizoclosmatium globosum TaxID=329046 RepID=A0A1Y2D4Q2_9FUNG|nr:G-alpha-domain-containing protein [Rhizoclosmatium globosum]|eukprot:ORY53565.1 G-alpha-domain-containing protein [Rhizoclosmatium globosum]